MSILYSSKPICDSRLQIDTIKKNIAILSNTSEQIKINQDMIDALKILSKEGDNAQYFHTLLDYLTSINNQKSNQFVLRYIGKILSKLNTKKNQLFGKTCDLLKLYLENSHFFMLLYYYRYMNYIEANIFRFENDIYGEKIDLDKIYDYTRCGTNVAIISELLNGYDLNTHLSSRRSDAYNWDAGLDQIIRTIRESSDETYYIICDFPRNNSAVSDKLYPPVEGPNHTLLVLKHNDAHGCPRYSIIQSYIHKYCPRFKTYSQDEIINAIRELNGIFYDADGNPIFYTKKYYTKKDNEIYQKYIHAELTSNDHTLCVLTVFSANTIIRSVSDIIIEMQMNLVDSSNETVQQYKEDVLIWMAEYLSNTKIGNPMILPHTFADILLKITNKYEFRGAKASADEYVKMLYILFNKNDSKLNKFNDYLKKTYKDYYRGRYIYVRNNVNSGYKYMFQTF